MSREPSFRAVRWTRTLNLLAQAALLLTLCGGLNYLAGRAGWSLDLTAGRRNTLSAESLARLGQLAQPVSIICTFEDNGDNPVLTQARRDLGGLLDAYVRATQKNPIARVRTEFLNVHLRPRRAKELKLENQPDTLLVISGERRRSVGLEELYRIEHGKIEAFLGEQTLTAAILDVTATARRKIYFLNGHGEMPADGAGSYDQDRGLSTLAAQLQLRAFDLATLDLTRTEKVPADAGLVIVAGPTDPISRSEANTLRDYLTKYAGRVLLLLPPGRVSYGLDDLLDDWKILDDDVLVCDAGPAGQNDSGDLVLSASATANHPVISALVANNIPVRFGAVRSVKPYQRPPSGFVVTPLIGTAKTAWGERSYRTTGVAKYDPGSDLPGPVTVAVASERASSGGRQPVPGGRLVVVGGADWIANARMTLGGNLTLALAAVNWAADRNSALALGDIPARPVERLQLSLTQARLRQFRYALVLALPGAVALLGLTVFWARRR